MVKANKTTGQRRDRETLWRGRIGLNETMCRGGAVVKEGEVVGVSL